MSRQLLVDSQLEHLYVTAGGPVDAGVVVQIRVNRTGGEPVRTGSDRFSTGPNSIFELKKENISKIFQDVYVESHVSKNSNIRSFSILCGHWKFKRPILNF
jgi:hypothetical protein